MHSSLHNKCMIDVTIWRDPAYCDVYARDRMLWFLALQNSRPPHRLFHGGNSMYSSVLWEYYYFLPEFHILKCDPYVKYERCFLASWDEIGRRMVNHPTYSIAENIFDPRAMYRIMCVYSFARKEKKNVRALASINSRNTSAR